MRSITYGSHPAVDALGVLLLLGMLNARCGSATVPAVKTGDHPPGAANEPEPITIHAGMTLKQAEQLLIEATLRYTSGNVSQAAKMLGLDRSTLHVKLKRYEIKR